MTASPRSTVPLARSRAALPGGVDAPVHDVGPAASTRRFVVRTAGALPGHPPAMAAGVPVSVDPFGTLSSLIFFYDVVTPLEPAVSRDGRALDRRCRALVEDADVARVAFRAAAG